MSDGRWVETFLDALSAEKDAATNTRLAYARDLADFSGWLTRRGLGLETAGPADIDAYLLACEAEGLSKATRGRRPSASSTASAASTCPRSSAWRSSWRSFLHSLWEGTGAPGSTVHWRFCSSAARVTGRRGAGGMPISPGSPSSSACGGGSLRIRLPRPSRHVLRSASHQVPSPRCVTSCPCGRPQRSQRPWAP